ncbi:WD domain G-beta repeat [Leishmania donovani]|uniref:WD_domain_G-beta_repeat_putative/Pfam:PF00400 n=1 Tax=Leishmania donovani TaxID=5661 RepID=A0A6J8FL24_LEIDO|nr:WD domain G-beta repeat [Leishmania donovani]VDZ46986.1 WD_domain_G-beta_repeat_putative/Pfam:PF00400 [Leishmania donovani]
MATVYTSVPGKEFAKGVTLDEANRIVRVDAGLPSLSALQVGMVVRSIGGVPVGDGRCEQARHHSNRSQVLVVLGAPPKDEFDLSSDDDDAANFKPPSTLPPLPPEFNNSVAQNSSAVVYEATVKCGAGGCVIIMCEGANPALAITLAAEKAKAEVMYIDTVARMKTRQTIENAGGVLKKSLEKGLWIYVEQATKSITLLRQISDCIMEVRAAGKMHAQSRVLLMCEPHPHFPEALMRGSVTLRSRLQNNNMAEVDIREDLSESARRKQAIHGDDVASSETAAKPEVTKTRKKVRISNQVNIVHLEKSTFMEMSASAQPPLESGTSHDGISRVAKYSFGSNENLISLSYVRDHRFAIGTNSGYVVLIDRNGLPLIQFRPHKACIWDVSFSSQFDFSTACEDGTSVIYNYSLANQELTTVSVASFQNDVFAVTYANPNDVNSGVLSGGLSATVCVLHSDRQNSSFIACRTSIQAMCATQMNQVIVGGGTGACTLIDTNHCVVTDITHAHNKKVPAVGTHGNVAVTGGFDCVLRLWDVRNGFHLTSQRQLNEVITAVAMNERYISACSGSSLYVWDPRKMDRTLAVKANAWKDLTRGLVLDGSTIVTASVDGVARIWEVN